MSLCPNHFSEPILLLVKCSTMYRKILSANYFYTRISCFSVRLTDNNEVTISFNRYILNLIPMVCDIARLYVFNPVN